MITLRKPAPIKMLRLDAVSQIVGLSKPHLRRKVREGTFPKPTRLGPNAIAWPDYVVQDWLRERIEESKAA